MPVSPLSSSALSSRDGTPSSSTTAFSRLGRPSSLSEQSTDLSFLRPNADIDELPTVEIEGKRYIREDQTSRRRKRKGWVKDYGTYLTLLPERKKTFWLCTRCDEKHKVALYDAQSTNATQRHMQKQHQISGQDEEEEGSGRIRDVLQMQRNAARGAYVTKTKHELFQSLLLEWIVDQDVSLSAVEHESFRNLLTVLASDVDHFLPKSGITVQGGLLDEFDKRKLEIKERLHEDAISKVHLTFDIWTSDNHLALLGIVAHYLDGKTWRNQSRLLALKEVKGAHTGENMAAYLTEVVDEYEIVDQMGFFTLDNAESNDACLRIFLRTSFPSLSDEAIKTRRIRCFGHVVNLAAKAFLFGTNAEAFEVEDAVNVALDRQMEQRQA